MNLRASLQAAGRRLTLLVEVVLGDPSEVGELPQHRFRKDVRRTLAGRHIGYLCVFPDLFVKRTIDLNDHVRT